MREKNIQIRNVLFHQLSNWWQNIDYNKIEDKIDVAVDRVNECFSKSYNTRLLNNELGTVNYMHSVAWSIFLYNLCRVLYENNCEKEAEHIYYLNKIMHSVDWFYMVKLPLHFMAEHPHNCVLGKAKYGDYLFVYQGTTIGGNRNKKTENIDYPIIGNNVVMYANSTILGSSIIGDNVIISANSYLINEIIPSNTIVFGSSPNLIIKKKTSEEILQMTSYFWR